MESLFKALISIAIITVAGIVIHFTGLAIGGIIGIACFILVGKIWSN